MKYYRRPLLWGVAYVGAIVVFSILYRSMPADDWSGSEMKSCFDYLYFSIVTITSLGFGDVVPVTGSISRILVMTEAVLGILFIGFFLNDIAMSQTKIIDAKSKEKEEEKRRIETVVKLKRNFGVLRPVMERYLVGIFEVVTPIEVRSKAFPQNIFEHDFRFEMKDLYNLYSGSLLLSNDFYTPVIVAHYKNQDVLYRELKDLVSNLDLSYWPGLEDCIYRFTSSYHKNQYREIIIGNASKYLGSGASRKPAKEEISEMIKQHNGNLEFKESNIMTPYEMLFVTLESDISLIQKINRLLLECCEVSKGSMQDEN